MKQKSNSLRIPLSKTENKVATKVLSKQGYSSRKIEEILGVDHATANRYKLEPTPEELIQFETEFAGIVRELKLKGLGLVQKRLLELIPKERRIDQVVRAGEYFEGKTRESTGIAVKDGDKEVKIVVTRGE